MVIALMDDGTMSISTFIDIPTIGNLRTLRSMGSIIRDSYVEISNIGTAAPYRRPTTSIPSFTTVSTAASIPNLDDDILSADYMDGVITPYRDRFLNGDFTKTRKILYQRDESVSTRHSFQNRSVMYKRNYRNCILYGFHELEEIMPINPRNIQGTSFNFRRGEGNTQNLYVGNTPVLMFTELRKIKYDGVYSEVYLSRIYPAYTTAKIESLKRLFLRHMGFNCIKRKGITMIIYPSKTIQISNSGHNFSIGDPDARIYTVIINKEIG